LVVVLALGGAGADADAVAGGGAEAVGGGGAEAGWSWLRWGRGWWGGA